LVAAAVFLGVPLRRRVVFRIVDRRKLASEYGTSDAGEMSDRAS
jgi:hypothetical protein